ncbi:MAG: hypothetical protein ACJAWW_002003 [Sulfurimonas sp.]|jgi:hypothetical protein
MQKLTQDGQNLVNDLSNRYNLSNDAVIHMIVAVNNGGGTMAQFNSPELGGGGQWMKGGMTMVGDMFNSGLKNTVDNLCSEISNALLTTTIFPVIAPGTKGSNQWWPTNLGSPFSSGSQNNTRYAVFPNRLAIELNGETTVYDTLNYNIGGVSQQQGGNDSLTFSSQFGTVSVSTLPIISGLGTQAPMPQTNFAQPVTDNFSNQMPAEQTFNKQEPAFISQTNENKSSSEIIDLIQKLAKLREAGALSDQEFNSKKSELLGRL